MDTLRAAWEDLARRLTARCTRGFSAYWISGWVFDGICLNIWLNSSLDTSTNTAGWLGRGQRVPILQPFPRVLAAGFKEIAKRKITLFFCAAVLFNDIIETYFLEEETRAC